MRNVAGTLQFALLAWMAALVLLILLRVLQGKIRTEALLAPRAHGGMTAERAISAVVFPLVIGAYAIDALGADMTAVGGARPSMPDVPDYLLPLLAGGNGIYLAGKFAGKLSR